MRLAVPTSSTQVRFATVPTTSGGGGQLMIVIPIKKISTM